MASRTPLLWQASLYHFRYFLGYGFSITLLLFVITAGIGSLPSGLSQAEMNQAVASTSMHVGLDFGWLINGPYNFLQKLSVETFGLSRLSLIAPSLIFGTSTIVVFALTIRHWFRDIVAVVVTVICMTSVLFIGMLRGGTPDIMLPFWTILLLYGAVRLLVKREHAFHWKLLIVFASLGLLYTPYGIYPLLGIFGSVFFHPHVRSRFRHIKRIRIIILSIIAFLGIIPLALYIATHADALSTLTGFDTIRDSFTHMRKNISEVFDIYLNLRKSGFSGTQVIPVVNLATIAIIILGTLKSIRDRYMTRSYILLTWAALTCITILLMPKIVVLTFMPAVLLVAIGMDALVRDWYSLFPLNPYARVAGLIPLVVLFISIGSGNVSHYFSNFNHISNPFYSQSLPAIQRALVVEGNHEVTLVTSPNEIAFYEILKKDHPRLNVTTTLPASIGDTPTFVLPTAQSMPSIAPSKIITTDTAHDSVALRVYRPQ